MPTAPAERTAPGDSVLLDGRTLDTTGVARLADGHARPHVDPAALTRVETAWHTARRLAATGRVYGRSTGVGAHRSVAVSERDADEHDIRLLGSHAGGIGAPLPARQVRSMLAVRINQLLAGGSGLRPALVLTLAEALRGGALPRISEYGSVGTGDLTALAELGLAITGQVPWATPSGAPAPVPLERGDSLALLSSNALTLGQAALVCHDLGRLLRVSHAVTALSLLAVQGSLEAYAAPVHAARPHLGSVHVAAEVRRLLGAPDRPRAPQGRIQDPFAFRCFPQVHGPSLEACAALDRVLSVDLNAAAENPLISEAGPDGGPAAYHHGGFFASPLTLHLDQLCLALLGTARHSAARLVALGRPDLTGLTSYLTDGTPGASGVMILEYSANAALADIHASAAPASLGHTVLSQGVEETASFATQAARKTLRAVDAYRLVLGCELVAAVRALRLGGTAPEAGTPAAQAYARAARVLDPDPRDRPLSGDVAAAAGVLDELAEL